MSSTRRSEVRTIPIRELSIDLTKWLIGNPLTGRLLISRKEVPYGNLRLLCDQSWQSGKMGGTEMAVSLHGDDAAAVKFTLLFSDVIA